MFSVMCRNCLIQNISLPYGDFGITMKALPLELLGPDIRFFDVPHMNMASACLYIFVCKSIPVAAFSASIFQVSLSARNWPSSSVLLQLSGRNQNTKSISSMPINFLRTRVKCFAFNWQNLIFTNAQDWNKKFHYYYLYYKVPLS